MLKRQIESIIETKLMTILYGSIDDCLTNTHIKCK